MMDVGLARVVIVIAVLCALGAAGPKIFAFERSASQQRAAERPSDSAILSDLPAPNPRPDLISGSGACRGSAWDGFPAVVVTTQLVDGGRLVIGVGASQYWGRPVPSLVASDRSRVSAEKPIGFFSTFEAPIPFRDRRKLADAIDGARRALRATLFCVVVRADQDLSVRDAFSIEASAQRVPGAQLQVFSELAWDD